jgi:exonuclease SbcC
MHISQIELENIKSHVSSKFEFARGTTAITGENGAGKTTIIEAISWVLFDLLEYKKEDFVRRGAKKGSVRLTFESGLDEREYVVFRDTGSAYHVTDPRLQTRIADKKEEVFRFLWQHLGLEPGTDLRSLFRQAIGVPQGTFTAIFLEGATERKIAFDRLLKVEEYRQAAEKLRETTRFLDMQVGGVRESIARAEGELSRADAVEIDLKVYAEQVRELTAELDTLANTLSKKQKLVDELNLKAEEVRKLTAEHERLLAEAQKAELITRQRDESLKSSKKAVEAVSKVKPAADKHAEILGLAKELERERNERDRLRTELAKIETAIVNVRSDQKRLQENLDAAHKATQEIETLRPKVEQQETLEKDIARLRDEAAAARAAVDRMHSVDLRLVRLREAYKKNSAELKEAEEKAAMAAELTALESRTGELMRALQGCRQVSNVMSGFRARSKTGSARSSLRNV